MKQILPWILGIAALAMMYGGWVLIDRQINQNAEELAARYDNMSEEEVLEDVMLRANKFNAGLGGEDLSDDLDGMLVDAEDPAVAERARQRRAERRRKEQEAEAAAIQERESSTTVFLWVALVGLGGIVVGGVVGGVLMLRKPREDDMGPPRMV